MDLLLVDEGVLEESRYQFPTILMGEKISPQSLGLLTANLKLMQLVQQNFAEGIYSTKTFSVDVLGSI